MAHETLLDPQTLHRHLDDPGWVVVDCRFNLAAPEAGREAYRSGHIPGARYAHLDNDLSGPVTPQTGRHPLPDPEQLADVLGSWGIDGSTQVVAYDDAGGFFAARLWWLLRWLGHRAGALLDGGLQAWRTQGLVLNGDDPRLRPRHFPKEFVNRDAWVDAGYVLSHLDGEVSLLVDARGAARYRGESEPIDPVAGHVPGAVNLPCEENLNADGRFLHPDALRQRFRAALGERSPREVVHMCGSGVTACHNLLAMEIAGLSGSRLYAGSWSEWIRDPARPIARSRDDLRQ